MKNMNDLLLICSEFGFVSLLAHVSDFISGHSGAEDEAQKVVSGIAEENFQVKEALFPLREALSGLRTANLHLAVIRKASSRLSEENRTLREQLAAAGQAQMKLKKVHEQEITELSKEREDLRAQFAQEMTKMRKERAKSDEANRRILQDLENLRKQLAQEDANSSRLAAANVAQKETMAALRKEQESFTQEIGRLNAQIAQEKAKFAQELGSLKAQFEEERMRCDEASKQNMREHESLRKQNPAPPPAAQRKPASPSPVKPVPPPKPPTAPRTQFPFTSDPPEWAKMPAGDIISSRKSCFCRKLAFKNTLLKRKCTVCEHDRN
jgi:septal ring factor EnvC (AmiA/AmiB activator)